MKNILFITHYSNLYGANKSLINLIDGLKKYDIDPYVVIPGEGKIEKSLTERRIKYKILPVPGWISGKPASNYRKRRTIQKLIEASRDYKKIIKDWFIDIIYTNSSVSPIGRLVAFQTGKPHIWHIREFLDLDYQQIFIFPRWLSLKFISSSKSIICNSIAVRDHFFDKKTKKVKVVYNGVASEKQFNYYKQVWSLNNSFEEFVFSIVGTLYAQKNQHVAIKAVADLIKRGHKVRLIIAGDGRDEYRNYCEDLTNQLGVKENVEFTGYVDDPYDIYQRSNCLLVCSEFEAMGRVTVEAMSACLPILAKNSGGTPEIMVHENTGFLYENYDELVDYMEKLVNNPPLARKMGLQGWDYAKDRFTIEKYTRNIYDVVRSL